jgi:hypothetical protein
MVLVLSVRGLGPLIQLTQYQHHLVLTIRVPSSELVAAAGRAKFFRGQQIMSAHVNAIDGV